MDLAYGEFRDLVEAVQRAGRMAQELQGRVAHAIKRDGTAVTDMDRDVESQLRILLHARFPADRVLGEEQGFTGPEGGSRVWVIDPIDGTTNYALGLPVWAVSLGLLEEGVPQWGCVFLPVLNQTYLAKKGEGAARNGDPIAPLDRNRMENEDILGITSEGVKEYDYRVPQKIRAMGSAAAQAVFVAGGHYVGYFLDTWYIWDIAAALLIAREAGVRVTDWKGRPFDRFPQVGLDKGPPLLFGVPAIHAQLLSLIGVKDRPGNA